ncbi:flagellar biosynthesis protein FlhF [Paenisporosarcina sp. TG-14]|uniref:flagellar biosynthesis protein FlhF n=1 Tax=Paenisporosarcina sp. TG-14 TaxID=1231057 RepID=UPI001ED9923F|nr:flagellar biosynthesis protein FlhF [Paenisporosarcina sp. TG-14]
MAEVIPMIKKDLGSEALILNTKKVKMGGFIGLFKKDKLEVIAAVETQVSKKLKNLENEKLELRAPKQEIKEIINSNQEKNTPIKEEGNITNELISELKNIKQFMMQMIEEDRLPASLKSLNKQLIKEDITPEIQNELFSKLMLVLGQNPDYTKEQVHNLARTEIIKIIIDHQKSRESKDPDIICFIGPTGVGKTTTIAKIAADYMLREDKKVGLITSDTYRIAAVEQLKTYANILNIPIKIVESAADLNDAMSDLSECDIVLMDTAGRNYQQKQYIDELEMLFPDKNKIQINLVLSLTSKYEDMKKIIENFDSIVMDQLLLTKKDETVSSGAILNLIYHYSIPIPYITNGQNVPDDIFAATPELIANFVLGEDDND